MRAEVRDTDFTSVLKKIECRVVVSCSGRLMTNFIDESVLACRNINSVIKQSALPIHIYRSKLPDPARISRDVGR